jgi:hypothetical protein
LVGAESTLRPFPTLLSSRKYRIPGSSPRKIQKDRSWLARTRH